MAEVSSTELEIRKACDDRDYRTAATIVVRAYGPEIFRFLCAKLRNADLAAEAFSQFTEDLWRGIPGFANRSTARVWAYAVSRHAASRVIGIARRERRQVPLSEATQLSKLAHRVRTETMAFMRTEVKQHVEKLREQLSPDDQVLLLLRVNRGLKFKEIAEIVQYEGGESSQEAIDQEAARLRKRFQLLKERLRKMART